MLSLQQQYGTICINVLKLFLLDATLKSFPLLKKMKIIIRALTSSSSF